MAEILSVRTLHEGWSSFRLAEVRLDDGATATRAIESHGQAVGVLPYDPGRRVALLVRAFRAPLLWAGYGDGRLTEALAGVIDGDEAPEAAARREAMEEAGLKIAALEPVATAFPSPGVSTERITLYLAAYRTEDRVGGGGGAAGEHENLKVLEIGLAELAAKLVEGELRDMKTITLVLALQVRRPELFQPR